MIRIARNDLDAATDALLRCAQRASNVDGLRIVFPLTREAAEAAVCGALSIVAPLGGPVTPNDVRYYADIGKKAFP